MLAVAYLLAAADRRAKMSKNTSIEWCTATWNPIIGCTKISDGCKNCYAYNLHKKRHKAFQTGKMQNFKQYAKPFSEIQLFENRLNQPLKWKRPERIFVNSMSDLFHDDIPDDFIKEIFRVMAVSKHHTFMVLTKRPERMLAWFKRYGWNLVHTPHIWLGVSIENQKAADERIPYLLQTPAAVRFLSCEPLLSPVDLQFWFENDCEVTDDNLDAPDGAIIGAIERVGDRWERIYDEKIDWVIVGGESGPNARPVHPDWVRSLRDQCAAVDVPFFFKQWGTWLPGVKMPRQQNINYDIYQMQNGEFGRIITGHWWDGETVSVKVGKKKAGRVLDSKEWNEIPGKR